MLNIFFLREFSEEVAGATDDVPSIRETVPQRFFDKKKNRQQDSDRVGRRRSEFTTTPKASWGSGLVSCPSRCYGIYAASENERSGRARLVLLGQSVDSSPPPPSYDTHCAFIPPIHGHFIKKISFAPYAPAIFVRRHGVLVSPTTCAAREHPPATHESRLIPVAHRTRVGHLS